MRKIEAFLIAPAFGAFVSTVIFGLFQNMSAGNYLTLVMLYGLFGSIFGLLSGLFFGWPIVKVFERYNLERLWQYIIAGIVCALPFLVGWFYPFNSEHWCVFGLTNSLYFFATGIIASIFYWYNVVKVKRH